jgi:hypothetical protein
MTDEISFSKSLRELEKNYRILALTITGEITDRLNPLKVEENLKKKLHYLSLRIYKSLTGYFCR